MWSYPTVWKMPVIVKRLDARYDWLTGHWGQRTNQLIYVGNGCEPSPSVTGAVAWVSEGNCSFFTKVSCVAEIKKERLERKCIQFYTSSFLSDRLKS